MTTPIWTGSEWSPELLERAYNEIEKIGVNELGLSIYPNQIEVVSSEQMLDSYASTGMPIFYHHWSFGKAFTQHYELYKRGMRGLAYELVINSSPCINYLMDDNTMTMQALVMAHAGLGHNHVFKNNHMFKTWTDAEAIIDYLVFARDYVAKCEEKHGRDEVEKFLDSCHALQTHGVDRFRRPPKLSPQKEIKRQQERLAHRQQQVSEFYRIMPDAAEAAEPSEWKFPREPEENLIYFFEKHAPDLEPWQRELLRITRKMAQYFYPQSMTKVLNEGAASLTHYEIMNRLHDRGLTTESAHLEFLHSHSSVLFQPDFDDPRYSGLNPYVLGFNILRDVQRACVTPDDEDRAWFGDVAGCNDPWAVFRQIVEDFRDESFIRQFLGPKVIRAMRLFGVHDPGPLAKEYSVTAIHNERGYRDIGERLADQYEWHNSHPQIEVLEVDRRTRTLTLLYTPHKGRKLSDPSPVMRHIRAIWGYPVWLKSADGGVIAGVN